MDSAVVFMPAVATVFQLWRHQQVSQQQQVAVWWLANPEEMGEP